MTSLVRPLLPLLADRLLHQPVTQKPMKEQPQPKASGRVPTMLCIFPRSTGSSRSSMGCLAVSGL